MKNRKNSNKEVPLYQQILFELSKRIENGIYPVDTAIPSESALQEEFGVSRITVRRAIQELELSGYVRKEHGKGTFVLPHASYTNLVGAMGFSQETIMSGDRPSSIILEFKSETPPIFVQEYLHLEEDEEVYYLKRLRLKNGRILGLNETFISKSRGIHIEETELNEHMSLYAMYEENGLPITRATETIEAKMPSDEIKQALYMEEGDPVFRRERITYTSDNLPLEFSINTYKASEYKYVIELRRS